MSRKRSLWEIGVNQEQGGPITYEFISPYKMSLFSLTCCSGTPVIENFACEAAIASWKERNEVEVFEGSNILIPKFTSYNSKALSSLQKYTFILVDTAVALRECSKLTTLASLVCKIACPIFDLQSPISLSAFAITSAVWLVSSAITGCMEPGIKEELRERKREQM
ncbi:MAG: hypothetical protein JWO53_1040 [Chlamydiia bacterium]|nr:hypothetical protein [Chlamydiia bacterium]